MSGSPGGRGRGGEGTPVPNEGWEISSDSEGMESEGEGGSGRGEEGEEEEGSDSGHSEESLEPDVPVYTKYDRHSGKTMRKRQDTFKTRLAKERGRERKTGEETEASGAGKVGGRGSATRPGEVIPAQRSMPPLPNIGELNIDEI